MSNLLIITQKVDQNDPILGFFVRWVEEFAKHIESITVICLFKGEYNLPSNVKVLSLGKELNADLRRSARGLARIKYIIRFYRYIWSLRNEYDVVFVHMNPIYVVFGGALWRMWKKKISLWYTHKSVDLKLRIAEKFVHTIFTASKESFRLKSKKVRVMGHGIDVAASVRPNEYQRKRDSHALLCVGRLTPIKDQKTIVRACGILAREGIKFICTFIGGTAAVGDDIYQNELHELIRKEGMEEKISFKGSMPQNQLPPYYWQSGIHINACPTGGLDKVVIEGMLGGAIPIIVNEAFRDTLGEYADRLIFREGDAEDLAQHIKDLFLADDQEKIRADLEKKARETFDLSVLVNKIINWYETSQ